MWFAAMRVGYIPVAMAARAGAHTGAGVKKLP